MSGDQLDAPNQQVVRPDGSAPWDEGKGGSAPDKKQTEKQETEKREAEKQEAKPKPKAPEKAK